MFLKTSFFLDALASFHPFLLDGMDIGRIQGLSSDLELSLDSATYWLCDFSPQSSRLSVPLRGCPTCRDSCPKSHAFCGASGGP